MLKLRLMGTENEINWFGRILKELPRIRILEFSDRFPNKGTKNYFRTYVEIEKNNLE